MIVQFGASQCIDPKGDDKYFPNQDQVFECKGKPEEMDQCLNFINSYENELKENTDQIICTWLKEKCQINKINIYAVVKKNFSLELLKTNDFVLLQKFIHGASLMLKRLINAGMVPKLDEWKDLKYFINKNGVFQVFPANVEMMKSEDVEQQISLVLENFMKWIKETFV